MTLMNTNGRNERMDFFKGVLMFGVIWGHVITNLLLNAPNHIAIHWIIRTYDMPLFMVISGYFLHFSLSKRNLRTILTDKLTTIFIPTVIWDLAISYGRSLGSLYFLWAVFFSSVFLSVIVKSINHNVFRVLICILFMVCLNFVPLRLSNLSYLFPFFALGFFVNEFRREIFNRVCLICVGLFIILLCFWKIDFTVWATGPYFQDPTLSSIMIVVFRYVIGVVGSMAFISVFNIIFEYYSNHRTKLFDFIVMTGKETLAVYILQIFIICKVMRHGMIWITGMMGFNPLTGNMGLYGYVITPLLSLLVLYLTYNVTVFVKASKYTKWMFGFKLSSNSIR